MENASLAGRQTVRQKCGLLVGQGAYIFGGAATASVGLLVIQEAGKAALATGTLLGMAQGVPTILVGVGMIGVPIIGATKAAQKLEQLTAPKLHDKPNKESETIVLTGENSSTLVGNQLPV